MWEMIQRLMWTETVIGPGIYVLCIWAAVVVIALFAISKRKNLAKYTAAYLDKYPEAVKVLITEYLNTDEAIIVKSVNGQRPAFFKKYGIIEGFYVKPGTIEFEAKRELYGMMGDKEKSVKSTGWIDMDFEVEEGSTYSLRFDEKDEAFTFFEIEVEVDEEEVE